MWRIVDTDNFGGDYPDEKFVGEPFSSIDVAKKEANRLNGRGDDYASRYYKVVADGYKLLPGFTP